MVAIIVKTAKAPLHAPAYGGIANADKVELAAILSARSNLIDLSDNEHTLTLSDNSIDINSGGAIMQNRTGIDTTLDETDYDSYTVSGVVKIVATGDGNRYEWLCGNWSDIPHGMGLHMRDETATHNTSTVRGLFYYVDANGAGKSAFVDLSLPASDFDKYHFYTMTQSKTNTGAMLTVSVPSLGLTATRDMTAEAATASSTFDFSGSARKTLMTDASKSSTLRIGRSNSSSTYNSGYDTIIKEFIFAQALTTEQVLEQYEKTKKRLRAEGAIDVGHWE